MGEDQALRMEPPWLSEAPPEEARSPETHTLSGGAVAPRTPHQDLVLPEPSQSNSGHLPWVYPYGNKKLPNRIHGG